MKRLIFAAAFAAATGPAFAGPQVTNSDYAALLRAGDRSGPVCAFYRGKNDHSALIAPSSFSRQACFSSLRECRSWLYAVQTAYPIIFNRQGCSRRG